MGPDNARIGHQAMKLPPVGAGGVHAQHVLPRPSRLEIDLIGHLVDRDRHIATGNRRHCSGALARTQRHRNRQGMTEYQPFPDSEHSPHDVRVLHEDELVALNGKLRNRYIMARCRDGGAAERPE